MSEKYYKKAPKGKVWQCGACGKRSKDIYGMKAIDYGWDVSCALNAVLVESDEKVKTHKSEVF